MRRRTTLTQQALQEHKRQRKAASMALDQREQYRQDAEALDRNANIAAFFAAISEQGGDEAGAEQARSDENTLNRWAQLDRDLATA